MWNILMDINWSSTILLYLVIKKKVVGWRWKSIRELISLISLCSFYSFSKCNFSQVKRHQVFCTSWSRKKGWDSRPRIKLFCIKSVFDTNIHAYYVWVLLWILECLKLEMLHGSIQNNITGMKREHEIMCDLRFASCEVNTRHIFSRVKCHSTPPPFFLHPFSLSSLWGLARPTVLKYFR